MKTTIANPPVKQTQEKHYNSPGRPAAEVKLPRRKMFTVQDAIDANPNLSSATIRKHLAEMAERGRGKRPALIAATVPLESGRGHPLLVFEKRASLRN